MLQYVYSAWAPQFADKLHLSATQSNLVGLAGNLGMYTLGVPVGLFIDTKGPRLAVIAGSILLGLGYFPLRQAYESGSGSVPYLCLVSYLTGLGGCMAFAASVKTSALNWPHHRGTATAFPLAAFGLSAFFFSVFGSLFFPGDTGAFLILLAAGTFGLTFVGFFFLRVLPHTPHYHVVPPGDGEDLSESQQLRRTVSEEARSASAAAALAEEVAKKRSGGRGTRYQPAEEPGRSPEHLESDGAYQDLEGGNAQAGANGSGSGASASASTSHADELAPAAIGPYASIGSSGPSTPAPRANPPSAGVFVPEDAEQDRVDETSSLMSKSSSSSSSSSLPGEVLVQSSVDISQTHRVDIRGWKLLRNIEFWQFFSIMGVLAGIGLMTIKYVPSSCTHRFLAMLTAVSFQQHWPQCQRAVEAL